MWHCRLTMLILTQTLHPNNLILMTWTLHIAYVYRTMKVKMNNKSTFHHQGHHNVGKNYTNRFKSVDGNHGWLASRPLCAPHGAMNGMLHAPPWWTNVWLRHAHHACSLVLLFLFIVGAHPQHCPARLTSNAMSLAAQAEEKTNHCNRWRLNQWHMRSACIVHWSFWQEGRRSSEIWWIS